MTFYREAPIPNKPHIYYTGGFWRVTDKSRDILSTAFNINAAWSTYLISLNHHDKYIRPLEYFKGVSNAKIRL